MTHELSFKQWHHGYFGLAIFALGTFSHHSWITWTGSYILLDDLFQHLIQWLWDDDYASPLRYIYNETLWKWTH